MTTADAGRPDATQGIVFVVDDDPSVRKGLTRLVRSAGFHAEAFASAEEFLRQLTQDARGCLVLDVQMPGLSGLELQDAIARLPHCMPIIFITGHGDIPMSVRAMKRGAVDFLSKPFDDRELLDAIAVAMQRDRHAHDRRALVDGIRARADSLTPRELEVMTLVTAGYPNKYIGAELGISEKTVKVHRGRVMRKMAANSLADLVRDCEKLARGHGRG
jgi:FixJ family two-component response regulator